MNHGEHELWAERVAAGWSYVDHSPLGAGQDDRRGVVEQLGVAMTQGDLVLCPARVYAEGRVVLASLPARMTTPEGNQYLWQCVALSRFDDRGLVIDDHFFQIEQWDEALALFDAWSAEVVSR